MTSTLRHSSRLVLLADWSIPNHIHLAILLFDRHLQSRRINYVQFADFISFFLNIPWKPNYFIFKGYLKTWGGEGDSREWPLWIRHCIISCVGPLLFIYLKASSKSLFQAAIVDNLKRFSPLVIRIIAKSCSTSRVRPSSIVYFYFSTGPIKIELICDPEVYFRFSFPNIKADVLDHLSSAGMSTYWYHLIKLLLENMYRYPFEIIIAQWQPFRIMWQEMFWTLIGDYFDILSVILSTPMNRPRETDCAAVIMLLY